MTAAISRSAQGPLLPAQWQSATWADYERYREDSTLPERTPVFLHNGYLKIDEMDWEGISHAEVRDLFVVLLAFWFIQHPELKAHTMGGCLMEQAEMQAAATNLVLYVGDGVPTWIKGEKRRID